MSLDSQFVFGGPPVSRNHESAAFFDGAARDTFMLRRCNQCRTWVAPSSRACSNCFSSDLSWHPSSGTGSLFSWTLVRHVPKLYAETLPIVIAEVELDEGPHFVARLVDVDDGADLDIGLRVASEFVHPAQGEPFPVFAIAAPFGRLSEK
jgi:uncharacterized protein